MSLGINSVFEDRRGGDMQVLMRYPNATHQFYIENQSFRNTFELNWDRKVNATGKFNVKADLSFYKRNITTNVFGMRARQLSYFTEASYVLKKGHHDWVAGINLNGERFRKLLPDSSSIDEYSFFTAGLFVQDDWHIHPKFTVEAGLRNDLHNVYGNFFLPRLALLYKINNHFNARVSGGMGYKVPTVFSNEVDERSYQNLRLDPGARAERSEGINADINFKKTFSGTQIIVNQSFYYTRISRPLVAFSPPGLVYFYTASQPVDTRGLETWIQVNAGKLETYFGYTLTDARKRYDASQPRVVLSARNKFATVIGYTITEKFTAIAEGSYTGHQYLDDGSKTPGYPLLACMLKFETGRCTFVLNGENLLNYRQSKKESILLLPTTNPGFRQLWAPIDGVVVNLSFKLRF